MITLLIIIAILIALGGFGGPAVGYGTYSPVMTGGSGLLVIIIILVIVFGFR